MQCEIYGYLKRKKFFIQMSYSDKSSLSVNSSSLTGEEEESQDSILLCLYHLECL